MIKLNNLSVGYSDKAVLSNINLTFEDGLIFGVLAKSGIGKTTLLKTIAGLLRPLCGEVFIDGAEDRGKGSRQQDLFDCLPVGHTYGFSGVHQILRYIVETK